MIIAGVVIQTIPNQAGAVAERLATVPGLAIKGDDGDCRIAAVWEAESGVALEAMGEELVAADEAVVGVYPTFAGEVDEE